MKWVAVFVVLFGGVVHAADPLAEAIAPYKKPGARLEVADFATAPVPDADNAANEVLAAAKLIKDQTAAFSAFDKLEDFTPPLADSTVQTLRKVLAENPAVVTHVDAAMSRGGIDWHV